MPVLNNCCCCISLRIGGLILGILTFVGSCLLAATNIVALLTKFNSSSQHFQLDEIMRQTFGATLPSEEERLNLLWVVRMWLFFYVVAAVVLALCSGLLIAGAAQVSELKKTFLLQNNKYQNNQ